MRKSAAAIVRWTRQVLRRNASPAYVRRVQMFFKSPVRAYGWRTKEVRRLATALRREISASGDNPLLFATAEKFFSGPTLEESHLGVALLERSVAQFGDPEFRRLERWLRWVNRWDSCDALSGSLLGPLIVADARRLPRVFRWAKAKNKWHRRAAAVALVPAARKGLYLREILRIADCLLLDDDYMVHKGVGWLLKEASTVCRPPVVDYLLRVRRRAPRLVLRTACEKLPARDRRRILA